MSKKVFEVIMVELMKRNRGIIQHYICICFRSVVLSVNVHAHPNALRQLLRVYYCVTFWHICLGGILNCSNKVVG